MAHINLNTTLYIAGPLEQMAPTSSTCHFALAVSAGMSDEAADDTQKHAWLAALYPWQITGPCTEVLLYAIRDDGTAAPLQSAHVIEADLASAPFADKLKAATVDKLDGPLFKALRLAWNGTEQQDATVSEAGTREVPDMPVAALLHSLTTLPAKIASITGAVLYFKCEGAQLDAIRTATTLVAIPAKVCDVRAPGGQLYENPAAPQRNPDGVFTSAFPGQDGPVVWTPGLPLSPLPGAGGIDLSTYWLPVERALGTSLTGIEHLVGELLDPVASVGVVTAVDIVAAGWLTAAGQGATLAQAERFVAAALAQARKPRPVEVGQLLARALAGGGDARAGLHRELRAAMLANWAAVLAALKATTGELSGMVFNGDVAVADRVLAARFPLVAPETEQTAGAGEAVEICVGHAGARLIHADNPDGAPEHAQMAGVGIVVRRAVAGQGWRLATAGVPVCGQVDGLFDGRLADPKAAWLAEMAPAPLTSAYVNQLLSMDFVYDGAPMRNPRPLDHVHPVRPTNLHAPDLDAMIPFSLHSPNGVPGIGGAEQCRTPPLRYGDTYQIAAFAIDRVGCMPAELTGQRPWALDFTKLAGLPQDRGARIDYLRRVPPGPIQFAYVPTPNTRVWPPVAAGVALRVTEYLDATELAQTKAAGKRADAARETRQVLVLAGDQFIHAPDSHTVELLPPGIDEHTLMRWAMPTVDAADKAAQLVQLKGALQSLFLDRNKRMAAGLEVVAKHPIDFPHDPAICGFWLRASWVDRDGVPRGRIDDPKVPRILHLRPKDPTGASGHFKYAIPTLRIKTTSSPQPALTVAQDGASATLELPAGAFALIDAAALITEGDWNKRFSRAALGHLLEAAAPTGYVALTAQHLYAEVALSALPDAADAYSALALRAAGSGVEVRLAGKPRNLAFVDSCIVHRQRWIWRNRPLVDTVALGDLTKPSAETRRLMASGPPRALLDADADVRDSDASRLFDAVAALDRGIANRSDFGTRFPRGGDGAPQPDAALLFDTLDGCASAEYLRYGLELVSRYRPLITAGASSAVRALRNRDPWRRFTIGYRGDTTRIKPPKLLAVIPMTHGFNIVGTGTGTGTRVTPVLILLDEIWFREYGMGERLEVRLALENTDIGEQPQDPRPYRIGGLPDHYLGSNPSANGSYGKERYFNGRLSNDGQDMSDPILLNVFGPFGYSFERSGNEALANASVFVAYPPAGVAPHFAMFLRLARTLDLPSRGERSVLSDELPVYTLPDADDLVRRTGKPGRAVLRNGRFVAEGLDVHCEPGAAQAARKNYLYCLLVSEEVEDGGRGVRVELPHSMICLSGTEPPDLVCEPAQLATLPKGRPFVARIVELLLNGRDAPQDGLRNADTLGKFWRLLLPDEGAKGQLQGRQESDFAGADAPAMVRRVSCSFPLLKEN